VRGVLDRNVRAARFEVRGGEFARAGHGDLECVGAPRGGEAPAAADRDVGDIDVERVERDFTGAADRDARRQASGIVWNQPGNSRS
jgi:hypothetical protein